MFFGHAELPESEVLARVKEPKYQNHSGVVEYFSVLWHIWASVTPYIFTTQIMFGIQVAC